MNEMIDKNNYDEETYLKDQLIKKWLCKIRGLSMYVKRTDQEKLVYQMKGGLIWDDKIRDEVSFLRKYAIVVDGNLSSNPDYVVSIDAFRTYFITGKFEFGVYSSFFLLPCVTLFSLVSIPSDYTRHCDVTKEELKESESLFYFGKDILGFFGDMDPLIPDTDYKEYFDYVVDNYTHQEIIKRYRMHLNFNSIVTPVRKIDYTNPYEFVHTMNKQFGIYYETMMKALDSDPYLQVFCPNDGLGIISIICSMLSIPYVSYETYPIGSLAVSLDIITSDVKLDQPEGSVIVVGNLSNYLDVAVLIRHKKYIVLEENRLYMGIELEHLKFSTHGKVTTNVIDSDDFITGGYQIATSKPMLVDKKNVPLSEKAEMFLLESGLQVYTDDRIVTCTKAHKGGDNYIDVRDLPESKFFKRGRVKDKCSCGRETSLRTTMQGAHVSCSCGIEEFLTYDKKIFGRDFLNVTTRNRPYQYRKGKMGQKKFFNDDMFYVDITNEIFSSSSYEKFEVSLYDNPRELKYYYVLEGFYIANCRNPKTVRFLFENGVKKNLLYIRSLDKEGRRYYVFRDVALSQQVSVEIE